MKMLIVAVKDRAAEMYGRPFNVRNTAEAIRSFTDETNNAESQIHKHPEDYDLYELGTFDDETGQIEGREIPRVIVRAQDLTRPEN